MNKPKYTSEMARLGQRIEALRIQRGIGITQLATIVGIHEEDIRYIEKGMINMRVIELIKIANSLNTNVKDLIHDI